MLHSVFYVSAMKLEYNAFNRHCTNRWTENDVFCYGAIGEGILEMVGVHTRAMRNDWNIV